MELTINGTNYTIADGEPRPLLWAIRDELGLTGTKYGCGAGYCGACTVHIDGAATRSCQVMTDKAAGADIRTIEGLAENGALHPVQQAFLDVQVPQCGWCMPGQMMTAAAFLQQNAAPTDEQIVEAMGDNYCRCGCYVRIKQAVRDAATQLAAAPEVRV